MLYLSVIARRRVRQEQLSSGMAFDCTATSDPNPGVSSDRMHFPFTLVV
jgi:hypothetical protein